MATPLPSWYINKPAANDNVNSFLNALIPYMSPEDARRAASSLSLVKEYKGYAGAELPPAPTVIDSTTRASYLSSDRANNILSSIKNMAALTKKTEAQLGPGYQYLKNVVSTMQRLGGQGGEQISRARRKQLQSEVQGLKDQAQDNYDLAPYAALTDYITNPGFSAGSLNNTSTDQYGNVQYGRKNKKLFG